MEHSESIANLATALSASQAEMPSVPFDSTNPFLKNRYASLGALIETARPILQKNGLSVSQIVVSYDGQIGIETVLMHVSGEWMSSTAILPMTDEKGKSQAQVAGSIVTYLRRYSYAAILGLYAEEDNDGNNPAPAKKNSKTKKQQEQPSNKHWIKDAPTRKKFWTYCKKTLGLTEEEVHEALGYAHVEEFPGTKAEALECINEYADIKAEHQSALDEAFPRDADGNPIED